MNYVQNNWFVLHFYVLLSFLIYFYRNIYTVTKNLQATEIHLYFLVSQGKKDGKKMQMKYT